MKEQTEKPKGSAVAEVALMDVAIEKIEVVSNIRKSFDPSEMAELTASVRKYGIIQPLSLARTDKEGSYRLIAGERRLRAAKAAQLGFVPAKVVKAEPATIAELQMVENLQRKDLGPIEQARGFKKLRDEHQYAIEGIAASVDKSVKFVTRSIRLLELPKEAVQAIEKGALTPEHGHQILRVPEDRRPGLVNYALTAGFAGLLPTLHALKSQIEQRMEKDLSRACFPKDKPFAEQIACTACPYNTGNQNVLFEGATAGHCTNGGCFTRKTNAFLRDFKEKAGEKQFKGLKCVGMAATNGNTVSAVKGAAVLRPEEVKSAKVQAMIEKAPEKFGFAVLKPSAWGEKTPSAVLVCKDPELMQTSIRKAVEDSRRPPTQEERERNEFVREAQVAALFAEGAATLKSIKKTHLVDIVLALRGCDDAFNAVGVPEGKDLRKSLQTLKEKDLLRLAWLCALDSYEPDADLKKIGVSAAQVRKDAVKGALAAWEEALKAKAVAPEGKEVGAENE